MRVFISFVVGLMLFSSAAYAQSGSADTIRLCGENLRTAAYNTFYAENNINMSAFNKAEFCSEYDSNKSGDSSGNVTIPIKGVPIGGGFSSSHAKAVYSMECSSEISSGTLSDDFVQRMSVVSQDALSAYKVCLENREGVFVSLDAFNPNKLGVKVTNFKYSPVKLKRFDTLILKDIKCVGSLAEADNRTSVMEPRGTLSMICARQEAADGSLPEMTMLMEVEGADTWSYNWEGRMPCGTRGERSCTSFVMLDRREKYAEETGGYDIASIVSASSQLRNLKTMVQSLPTSCDASVADDVKEELRTKLRNQWSGVKLSSTKSHSCTNRSSSGKNCGCKYTLKAPSGFDNGTVTGAEDGYSKQWNGTKAQICMSKSGQGRDSGSVTANWKLSSSEIERRVTEDIAYIAARSSCFNGCKLGLSVDKNGICG